MQVSVKSILVVEDDPSIRECLVQTLEMEGFGVNSVCNGQEALDFLSNTDHPCLIFLDLMMPVMDGWTFLERLQQIEESQHIPIVVSSAVADRHMLRGVSAIVTKPYQLETILGLARQYCGSKV